MGTLSKSGIVTLQELATKVVNDANIWGDLKSNFKNQFYDCKSPVRGLVMRLTALLH